MKNYVSEGIHILLDAYEVSNKLLNNSEYLESVLIKACELSGATVLGTIEHKFNPVGVTLIVMLSESHFSIHTYVDLENKDDMGMFMVDGFTCGLNCKPEIGIAYIVNQLCNDRSVMNVKTFKRGFRGGIVDLDAMCEVMC